MKFPLFIARRLHADNGRKLNVGKPVVGIAMLGVGVGIAVMIISISVVLGFKHSIRNKVAGFGSHIQINNCNSPHPFEPLPISADKEIMKKIDQAGHVKHKQGFILKQGILKTKNDFAGILLKGVGHDFDKTFLQAHLKSGQIPDFSDTANTRNIVISNDLAERLQLKLHDPVNAFFIDDTGVKIRKFIIQGIYQTNLAQYDHIFCFTDLYTLNRLNKWNPNEVGGIEITLDDYQYMDSNQEQYIQTINRSTDKDGNAYVSNTIKELNPQIFSWLDLLDINVWIILALMTAVACVTMTSGLLIIILERTSMIGVLKAMGATNQNIRHVFLWFALFIIGKGLIIGNLAGITIVLIQKWLKIIKLDPTVYYVSSVPVELDLVWLLVLNIATIIICTIVLLVPGYIISNIHPAKSIKYE